MKLMLDQKTIQSINLFQNLTGSSVVDCVIEDDCIYFVVRDYGLAVGKGGAKIRNAEKVFKKMIKVFEYSQDVKKFTANVIPEAQDITENGKIIIVRVKTSEKARAIGKAGRNIKIINKFLQRLFDVEEVKVR